MKSVLVAAFALAIHAQPCPPGRTPLAILGVYHMDSGQDTVNLKHDDVLGERRQREIADLVERLARLAPTKIAIESARNSTTWNARYQQWLDGKYELGRNEIEQIGFRLAKRMNLRELSPVDYPMWMSGLTPIERHEVPAPASPKAPEPDSPIVAEIRAAVAKDEQVLATSTITQYLAYLNTPEHALRNHRWDVLANLAPGKGVALYETTDLATNWYKRNLRIFTNVMEITKPGDRVLLIIGAGHGYILRDLASTHPQYCFVDVGEFLRER